MADRPRLIDQWRASPWTIKAFAALEVVAFVFSTVVSGGDYARDRGPGRFVFSALVTVFVLYWLLRRSRAMRIVLIVWIGTALVASVGLLFREPPYGYAVAVAWMFFSATSLGLMLHPATRAWCDRRLRLTDPERLSRSRTPEV